MTDNQYADMLMAEALRVKLAPAEALEDLQRAREHVETLRSKMTGVSGIRYDRDRVQTSRTYDLSDAMADLYDAERDEWRASMIYTAAISSLQYCCMAAGFSAYQTRIWMMYYGAGISMGMIAMAMRTTKSRVQYLLTGTKIERDFCFGIDNLSQYDILEQEDNYD